MNVLILRVLFVAFTFGWLFPGAPAMPRAEAKVTSAAVDRTLLPRAPVTRPDQTAAAPAPGSTAPAGAGSPATATPPPPSALAGLRRQGITPAILLAGDLLLLIVALIIVIRERCRRPP